MEGPGSDRETPGKGSESIAAATASSARLPE